MAFKEEEIYDVRPMAVLSRIDTLISVPEAGGIEWCPKTRRPKNR